MWSFLWVPPRHHPEDVTEGSYVPVATPDDVGDDPGPARLVGSANASAVVAVEVLVEHNVVLPRRVGLEFFVPPETGPAPVWADKEDRCQAMAQVLCDLTECHLLARTVGYST